MRHHVQTNMTINVKRHTLSISKHGIYAIYCFAVIDNFYVFTQDSAKTLYTNMSALRFRHYA